MSTLKVNNLQDLGADAVVTNGVIAKGALPSGSVLQVVSTTKTDVFTTTSATYVDITGLSATITPTSTSSKILIAFNLGTVSGSTACVINFDVTRNGTPVGGGTAVGSRVSAGAFIYIANVDNDHSESWSYLDSPSSTSALTYQVRTEIDGGKTMYLNRTRQDSDNADWGRSSSTITVMEIAG